METKNWKIDTTHSNIGFSIKHMMFTNVKGNFISYDGNMTMIGDDFRNAKIDISIDVDSINTNNTDRDNHLKSEDFFDVTKFPTIEFKSTSVEKKDGENYILNGEFLMHGITRPISLNVESSGLMVDPYGNTKLGLNITGKINRKEWGLNWNSALETGGVLVSEEVKFDIEIQWI